ncbi:MAG: sigma-70 family RNA polymerase sigma factor [Clostridiaceae bacterium]|nr:sigma-70 family RNA polymerase sigma factor [Clostridiaceae bacterium]
MKTINLRKYYPDAHTTDYFVEVSDDVAVYMEDELRREKAYVERVRYHRAYYSLDCDSGIERRLLTPPRTPEEICEQAELSRTLHDALAALPEKQRELLLAHVLNEVPKTDLAGRESLSECAIRKSICKAITDLKDELLKID